MDVARQLAGFGAPEGVTVVAGRQTSGRGRAGRSWASPEGSGLYLSILLRPDIVPIDLQPLAMVAGLAVCDALDPDHALGIALKWPNDLVVGTRKLGGILITSAIRGNAVDFAIVGIGVNLLEDAGRPEQAISLAEISGVRPADLVSMIGTALEVRYRAMLSRRLDDALEGWQSRLADLNRAVTIRDGDRTHAGILRGITRYGELVLETADGIIVLSSGELTRGPVSAE